MAATAPGFDASQVSPQDAIVTLRSLRRRFAEAFDEAEDPADLTRCARGGGLSPLGPRRGDRDGAGRDPVPPWNG